MNPENPKLFNIAQSIMTAIVKITDRNNTSNYSVTFDGNDPPRHIVYKKPLGEAKHPIVQIFDRQMHGTALTTFLVKVANGKYDDIVKTILHDATKKDGMQFRVDYS